VSPQPLAPSLSLHHMVRPCADADLPTVGTVLAHAFHDDPVLSWAMPDPARRGRDLPAMMQLLAARTQPHGGNRLNDTGTGAAVWAPPGAEFDPAAETRFETTLASLAGDAMGRIGVLLEVLERNHPYEPDHLYLAFLGVVPDHQGMGVGSALLRSVLDRADREGTPAYLEATSARNRALYERHGFVAIRELRVSDCPPLTAMWREPQAD
jgi:GNAT superfamily N-acetyltransferase